MVRTTIDSGRHEGGVNKRDMKSSQVMGRRRAAGCFVDKEWTPTDSVVLKVAAKAKPSSQRNTLTDESLNTSSKSQLTSNEAPQRRKLLQKAQIRGVDV